MCGGRAGGEFGHAWVRGTCVSGFELCGSGANSGARLFSRNSACHLAAGEVAFC
jgi:hypothetical protein